MTAGAAGYEVEGRRVAMPVCVRDATSIAATFLVPADAATRLIAEPRLRVLRPLPGRALCTIAALEYKDNDLGQYNELAVAFLVEPASTPPRGTLGSLLAVARGDVGAFIHRLPVTTGFSCAAGRDVWGFPKWVADIRFADAGNRRTCTLVENGAPVVSLTVPRGGRRRYADTPLAAWATRDGVLRRTPFTSGGEGVGFRLGGATLVLGRGTLADELRSLGLPRRALASSSIERLHARFDAAEPAGACPGVPAR
jgi:hypothetical protein